MDRCLEDEATLSMLDRLLWPVTKTGELGVRRNDPLQDLIARDLETLLNTRRKEAVVPAEYEEAATSILSFGVPELLGYGNLSSPIEQKKLCKAMEEAIRTFEPRLSNISVRMAEPDKRKLSLRFRLDATIEVLSTREVFEMGYRIDSGTMSVGQGGAA